METADSLAPDGATPELDPFTARLAETRALSDAPSEYEPDPDFDAARAKILAALAYATTDAGNAEFFVHLYGDLVRYDHARRRWLYWDSHRWRPDMDAAVHRMAFQSVRTRGAAVVFGADGASESHREKHSKNAIRSEARSKLDSLLALARTMKPVADDGQGWDTTPGVLGTPNGVVDMRTGELRDGRPEDRITMTTGVAYDPTATCPRWEQHLLEVLEDPAVVPFLQKLFGYSLTAEGVLHLLVFLMGTGRNGKGVTIRTAEHVLGDYAQVISAHAFAEERRNAHSTEVADLELSRFAYCEELGGGKLNTERLKDLSGGGMKKARRMREDTRAFPQTWQLWFTTNGLPRSDDNSWGFWERVIALDFPRQFVGADADPLLDEKLRAEGPGILAWMVRGAVAWYRDGLGEYPAAVVAKTAEYREDLDPLEPLIQSGYLLRCEPEVWTPTVVLFAAYREYAQVTCILPEYYWTERGLGTRLSDQYRRERHQVETTEGKKQLRGFHGIRPGYLASEALRTASWVISEDGKSTSAEVVPGLSEPEGST